MVLFFFFRGPVMMAFTTDAGIIETGKTIVIIIGVTTFIQTSQVVLMGCLRGSRDTMFAAAVSLLSIAFLRPGSAWLFCYPMGLGLIGAWFSLFFDQLIRMVFSMVRFNGGKWTQHKL